LAFQNQISRLHDSPALYLVLAIMPSIIQHKVQRWTILTPTGVRAVNMLNTLHFDVVLFTPTLVVA